MRNKWLLGFVILMALAMVGGVAQAAHIPNPTLDSYDYESITEYSWALSKGVDLDALTLDRGESGEVEYLITATRTEAVSKRVVVSGHSGWAHTIIIKRGSTTILETSVERNANYELFFIPTPGVRDYSITFKYNAPGVSKSSSRSFRISRTPNDIYVGSESVLLFDSLDLPLDSGLTFAADPDHCWPQEITGCDLDENGQYTLGYTLAIVNVNADYEETILVPNTAELLPLSQVRMSGEETPLATASALVTVSTPGVKIPPTLPDTGGSNLVFAGMGLLFAALGVALRR